MEQTLSKEVDRECVFEQAACTRLMHIVRDKLRFCTNLFVAMNLAAALQLIKMWTCLVVKPLVTQNYHIFYNSLQNLQVLLQTFLRKWKLVPDVNHKHPCMISEIRHLLCKITTVCFSCLTYM